MPALLWLPALFGLGWLTWEGVQTIETVGQQTRETVETGAGEVRKVGEALGDTVRILTYVGGGIVAYNLARKGRPW